MQESSAMGTAKTKPSLIWRGTRWIVSTTLTLAVVAGAGAAVFLGANTLADRAAATEVPAPAAKSQVSVRPLGIEDGYTLPRRFIGQVEAAASVPLSFELAGRLTRLDVVEGQAVEAGQVIARLDTVLLEAERDRLIASRTATRAQLTFAEGRLARAEQLNDQGFASQEALDQALANRDELSARIAETDAALATVAINLEKSVLKAPFDGRVGRQNVDGMETLLPGQAVVTLIASEKPQVRVGLPLTLAPEVVSHAEIEIDGRRYSALLAQLRPDIDPVTRTRTALFDVVGDAPLLFGQTATLEINSVVKEAGAWVALDALQESAGGFWTILVVSNGIVRNAAVEVLHAESERAFIRGTFENGADVITTGAHRVVPGQRVDVLQAGS